MTTVTAVRPRKSLAPYLKDEVQFYDYQIVAIRQLIRQNNFILADDMGLGKSLQAIAIFCADVIRGFAKTAIVVCPLSVKENWLEEFEKFTALPVIKLEGTPNQRVAILDDFEKISGVKVLLVNYEQVQSHLTYLNSMRFDVGIFDEAHYMKNYKSQRTKACLALRTRRSFMLTGTPMLNGVNELWPLLHKVDAKKWPKYWSFVNRFCVFGGYLDKAIIGVKNQVELREELSKVMIRRMSRDVLELKEPVPVVKKVALSPAQREMYDRVAKELMLTDAQGNDHEVENSLTKFLRLKQICGNTFTFNQSDDSAKMDMALEDAIQLASNKHKIIVFTQFLDIMDLYSARLEKAGIPTWQLSGRVKAADRNRVVKEWTMDPRPGAIVCMLQVAGIGLNMTAAMHIQFLDKLFVPGLNNQAIGRANRIGQQLVQPVTVLEYICRDTVESRVEEILRGKTKTVKDIVEGSVALKNLYRDLREVVIADAQRAR